MTDTIEDQKKERESNAGMQEWLGDTGEITPQRPKGGIGGLIDMLKGIALPKIKKPVIAKPGAASAGVVKVAPTGQQLKKGVAVDPVLPGKVGKAPGKAGKEKKPRNIKLLAGIFGVVIFIVIVLNMVVSSRTPDTTVPTPAPTLAPAPSPSVNPLINRSEFIRNPSPYFDDPQVLEAIKNLDSFEKKVKEVSFSQEALRIPLLDWNVTF